MNNTLQPIYLGKKLNEADYVSLLLILCCAITLFTVVFAVKLLIFKFLLSEKRYFKGKNICYQFNVLDTRIQLTF